MVFSLNKIVTAETPFVKAVVGKYELMGVAKSSPEELKDLVLISIQDPDDKVDLSFTHSKFKEVLHIKFWDVEYALANYEPINDDQAKEIITFILDNLDSKFVVHCEAGISRSAAVGVVIDCINLFRGSLKNMEKVGNNPILNHRRYAPNALVIKKLLQAYRELSPESYAISCKNCGAEFDKPISVVRFGETLQCCPECYEEL
jgi:predicted protein tyrosine phosphatase